MAKTKTTTVKEIIPDGVDLESGVDPALLGIDDDFIHAKILEDYPDSQLKVKVYKGGVFQFSTIEKVDEEMCQQYGGGKYTIHFIVNGKTVHKIYMEVAEPAKKSNGVSTDAASIQNQMLRDQLQWNQQMILALLGRQSTVAPATPMQDLIMAWNAINGQKSSFDPTNLIIKGIELADRVTGKGSEGDWKAELFKTLREVAPAVTAAMTGQPQPNGGNGATPMIPASTQSVPVSDEMLKQGLVWLKARIIAGMPVGLALEWLLTNANDPTYQPFIAMGLQKSFEDIVKLDNDFAHEPFNTWTRELLKGIKESFAENVKQGEEETE